MATRLSEFGPQRTVPRAPDSRLVPADWRYRDMPAGGAEILLRNESVRGQEVSFRKTVPGAWDRETVLPGRVRPGGEVVVVDRVVAGKHAVGG